MAVQDVVAGRTGKQIEAAKRAQTARLGQSGAAGKRKKCKKGKSCGASCIDSSKVCMVDIPWATGSQITKVAKAIHNRGDKAPKTVDQIKAKLKEHHDKLKEAAIAQDGNSYTKHRDKIAKYLKELKAKGEDVPNVPLPPWSKVGPLIKESKEAEAKGDEAGKAKAIQKLKDVMLGKKPSASDSTPPPTPTGKPKAKLDTLDTLDDFNKKLKDTYSVTDNPKLTQDSIEVAKVLGISNTSYPQGGLYPTGDKSKYDKIQNSIGSQELADGKYSLGRFTASFDFAYSMGMADKGNPAYDSYKKYADALDKLLTSSALPKTEVEKFRGFRATPERLADMIESAKGNQEFTHERAYSWSSALRIGKRFANKEQFDFPDRTERVIYRTVNKRGVPIEFVSSVPREDEVITPRNTKYKYLGYRAITSPLGTVFHVFDVEEY